MRPSVPSTHAAPAGKLVIDADSSPVAPPGERTSSATSPSTPVAVSVPATCTCSGAPSSCCASATG